MKSFFYNKNLILGLCTVLITISSAIFGAYTEYRAIAFVCLLFFSAFYICTLIYYNSLDVNIEKLAISLEHTKLQREALITMLSNINAISEAISKRLFDISNHRITLSIRQYWSIENTPLMCCESVYNILNKLYPSRCEISVSYVQLVKYPRKTCIKMVACKNYYNSYPNIYNLERDVAKDKFFDTSIFNTNNGQIVILLDENEIKAHFCLNSGECKYSQYVAIPIMNSDNKMVALLQITCFNGFKLNIDRNQIIKIVVEYLKPFTFLSLLSNEITSLVDIVEVKNESNSSKKEGNK